MNRKKFGKLIFALRREQLDNGTEPWSRKRLAQKSGVDEEILANIETGRKAIIHYDQLVKIANALNLTSGERKELLLAVSGVEESEIYHQGDTPEEALQNILAVMENLQQPAILMDQYFDIVAVNLMMLKIYDITANHFLDSKADSVTKVNFLRFLFAPEFNEQKEMYGIHQEKFYANAVMLFRASSLRYRATEYFQRLYSHLYKFDDFKKYIHIKPKDAHDVDNNLHIHLENKRFGLIQAVSSSIVAATTAGELKLFILTPQNEETARIFSKLAENNTFVFQVLQYWPNKSELGG